MDNNLILKTILQSIGDGVIVTDMSGQVTLINSAAEVITEWPQSAVSNKSIEEIICILDPKTRQFLEHPLKKVLEKSSISSLSKDVTLMTRLGREKMISCSGAPVYDDKNKMIGAILIFRDITETRRLEEFASRAQRLETAGRIASQVAHGFSNLLGPLTAYPALIRDELPADHPALDLVDQMEKSASGMAEINQQLLTLGQRGHYTLATMNLNDTVSQVIQQFMTIKDTISIKSELCKNLLNIRGGSSQIYRLVANLVSNASDAMREVGRLTIRTENFYVDQMADKYSRVPCGEYVKLTVSDTGEGIDPEIMPRIFDPFFTTRNSEEGRAPGLGLSVVHSIIEDHLGYLDYSSIAGQGTSFYVYLPITREDINIGRQGKVLGGNERILVVDDDVTQRKVSKVLLQKLGYEVDAVAEGESCLKLMAEKQYDLLLLDMILSGEMDGPDIYREALKIRPKQKAVLISGYAESERVNEAVQMGAGLFLRKPLTIKSISQAVRKILDNPQKSS